LNLRQTPAILERSGVGNEALLDSLKITKIVHLPGVGMNLQDQPGASLSAFIADSAASDPSLVGKHGIFAPVVALADIDDIFGPVEALLVAESLKSGVRGRAEAAVAAGVLANIDGATEIYRRATDLIVAKKQPIAEVICESDSSALRTILWPLMPLSRGHIHINSSDPFARPVITPRFFTDDYDVKTTLYTAKKAQSMYQTDAFKSIFRAFNPNEPGVDTTDEEWVAWLKKVSYGASHWLGTCAMMPREWGGVVDPELKVYGTRNLRIVDASILPLQLTAHPISVLYAVAHKAAHLITK
jgi:choline dehydrogenase